jgi:hypothetical protein
MFAWLFVVVLLVSAAFYLFQFGTLQEFSLSAFSANANFIRQKATEAKDYSEQIKQQKDQIDKAAQDILSLRAELSTEITKATQTGQTALALTLIGSGSGAF